MANILANNFFFIRGKFARYDMLVAHSDEYVTNGLTNANVIRNDRKMIARHSCVFVSIRGRSCGVANIMLLSHCGEYLRM